MGQISWAPTISFHTLVKGRLNRYQIVGLLVIASSLLSLLRFHDIPVGSFFDDAHYIVLAESLASGSGYRLISYPHMPVESAFPPGWSLLLLPIVTLFPGNFAFLKLLSFCFWLASIPLVYRLFNGRLQTPYLETLVALVALNPHLVGMSGTVMSEAAFLFFSLLALNLFQSWTQKKDSVRLLVFALVVALFTVMIRTIGVALLGALLLYLLLQWRPRQLAYLGVVGGLIILGLIPLAWFNLQNGGSLVFSSLYNQHLTYVLSRLGDYGRVWQHLGALSYETIANAIVPVFETQRLPQLITPFLTRLLSIALLLVILCGGILSARAYQAQDLYVILYVGILYLWVAYVGKVQPRLLLPIIPFLYFYLIGAVTWFSGRLGHNREKWTTALAFGLFSLFLLVTLVGNYHVWRNPPRDHFVDLSVGTGWVNENTAVDSIVMTADPVPDYLYARRQTVHYPRHEGNLEDYIKRNGVDYIIVKPHLLQPANYEDAYIFGQLLPFLQASPEHFQEVYRNSDHHVRVYRVLAIQ